MFECCCKHLHSECQVTVVQTPKSLHVTLRHEHETFRVADTFAPCQVQKLRILGQVGLCTCCADRIFDRQHGKEELREHTKQKLSGFQCKKGRGNQ